MALTTGTAANHNDLLDKLQAWLVGTVGWTQLAYTDVDKEATAVAIAGGGTGYAVDDVLTVSGGTYSTQTTLTVTSVSGGVIDGIEVTEPGQYSVIPSNPVSVTGGSGSGATFNMTYDFITTLDMTLSLQAPGNGASARVYLNFETLHNEGNAYYSWRLYGATAYDAGEAFGSMPGAGGPTYFNLWQNTIDYWFYANDRRVIVVAKCSTNYMSMYAGFFLPYALPSEYPFPLALIASYPEIQAADVNNARNSMIADPGGDGAAWYRRRTTETWVELQNQSSSAASIAPKTGQRPFVWPHKTGRTPYSGTGTNPNYWGPDGFHTMKLNANSESVLFQCQIIDLDDYTIVGALEGVFSTTGFNRATEQQLTVDTRTFRLFQRAFRNQPGDFFAVEEV